MITGNIKDLVLRATVFTAAWGLQAAAVKAQDLAELQHLYPGSAGVYTNFEHKITVDYNKKSGFRVTSEENSERMLLSELAKSALATNSEYQSLYRKVGKIEGYTLVPKGDGNYRKVKAGPVNVLGTSSESVFYDDIKEMELRFNNLMVGAKEVYHSETIGDNIYMQPALYFQKEVPVVKGTYSLSFPSFVDMGIRMEGIPMPDMQQYVDSTPKMITYTWTVNNGKQPQTYADGYPAATYVPHVVYYVKGYTDPDSRKYVPVLRSDTDLYHYLYPFVKDVNSHIPDDLAHFAQEWVKEKQTPAEKAGALYKWVQGNIRYVAFEDSLGGYMPRSASLVYQRRFGDCKDMSSLLYAMCRSVGIEAHYCWVGSREIQTDIRSTPLPNAFNHMICMAKIDNKWYCLDGTEPTMAFGVVPEAVQGKTCLIENGPEQFELRTLAPPAAEDNLTVDTSYITLSDGGTIVGTFEHSLTGYKAWNARYYLKMKTGDDAEDFVHALVSRGNNKFRVTQTGKITEPGEKNNFSVSGSFLLPDYAVTADNQVFVNLNLRRPFAGGSIDTVGRLAPVKEKYLRKEEDVVLLNIPKGYQLSYLPKNVHKEFPNLGSVDVQYESLNGKVMLRRKVSIDTLSVTKEQFADFNLFINMLNGAYKETVGLKKNNAK